MLWLALPLSIFGTTLLVAKKARAKNAAPVDDWPGTDTDVEHPGLPDIGHIETPAGQSDVRTLAAMVGAPAIWQDFFAMTAQGESKQHNGVGLGVTAGAPPWVHMNASKGEAKAAAKSYTSNIQWLQPCWPKSVYTFGSGGLFAMLPAAALAAFKDDAVYRCNHPWSIFDPGPSMVYAAWFARRLQGWKNWQGTVLSMRVGWGNPTAMGHAPSAEKRTNWSAHCQAVGLPPSFLDKTLPHWKPAPARELWTATGADITWLPNAAEGVA